MVIEVLAAHDRSVSGLCHTSYEIRIFADSGEAKERRSRAPATKCDKVG